MIKTTETLNNLVKRATKAGSVALDTEFLWTRTFYPRLGVVQAALPDNDCFLIDAFNIDDFSSLGSLLADPSVLKILHDPVQDLTILRRLTGAYPVNIFDTRSCSGFAGMNATVSLACLLRDTIGVELDKTETRTNWMHRPLTDEQIAYAYDDVRYLHKIREVLLTRLRLLNRVDWLEEEFSNFNKVELYCEREARVQYKRFKGAKNFSQQELSVLRELAAWREGEARTKDRPRGHILTDKTLLSLARTQPNSLCKLKHMNLLSERDLRFHGETAIKMVLKGLSILPENMPPSMKLRRFIGFKDCVDVILNYIKNKCETYKLDSSLVASQSDVIRLIFDRNGGCHSTHRLLRGWRKEFLGEEFLSVLANQAKGEV